ncbi:MAG: right-handed parallel beta-helix repeat-containing protein [Planctomycetota bacterium]
MFALILWVAVSIGTATGLGLPPEEPTVVHVDAREGSDDQGDGSTQAPYRTLTRGLKALDEAGPGEVRAAYGTYDVELGERFPLVVPAGVHLRGVDSASVRIDGAGADLLVRFEAGDAAAALSGVHLKGAQEGLRLESDSSALSVVLRDVRLDGLVNGVRVRSPRDREQQPELPPIRVTAVGLRAIDCEVGWVVSGPASTTLRLDECLFRECRVGVALEASEDEPVDAGFDPKSKTGRDRVDHDVLLTACRFESCSIAGLLRVGGAGTNDGPPYRFEGCTFARNRIGAEFRRPCADSPMQFRGCDFLENTHMGLRVTGAAGDAASRSVLEDSTLRWNGVGLHLTSSLPFTVRRCRVLSNAGNGLFVSNVLTPPTRVVIEDSLIGHNGAAGIYVQADNREFTAEIVRNTIVFNGASGIRNHERHAGVTKLTVEQNILMGNRVDLDRFEPEDIARNIITSGFAEGIQGNIRVDPGFVSLPGWDYRLRPDSPARDRGTAREGEEPRDVTGKPRDEKPDWGAYEYRGED